MKLQIEIPKEYEQDFDGDRFKEFFGRVLADIDNEGLCGCYEKETANMLLDAFNKAEVVSRRVVSGKCQNCWNYNGVLCELDDSSKAYDQCCDKFESIESAMNRLMPR